MNEIQSIDTLTAEILILKQQTAQNIIEIGKRLITVKESLPHGEWGNWLRDKVDFADRTARQFMKVAQEFDNSEIGMRLPISKVYALLDLPSEERENFVKENPVDEMTTRELQQAIKEKKALENKIKKLSKDNEKQSQHAEKLKKELDTIKDKNREELTDKEVEIENLKTHIKDIKEKLSKVPFGDNEELEKLQSSLQETESKLHEAISKIGELENKLKEKPIDVTETIVEKVPEEIEKELQELRAKVNEKDNTAVVKYSIVFNTLVENFKELLGTLPEIKSSDEATYLKYKNATMALINKMSEKL
ncbi:MAG: DUF3102 domain-containing protein [Bacillota bacterium]|nr:DUF3102 domain-containing protein [Bacillota bacterium]